MKYMNECVQLWRKYVAAPSADRAGMLEEILQQPRNGEELRILRYYFEPDPQASIRILKDQARAAAATLDLEKDYQVAFHIPELFFLAKKTLGGWITTWDMLKFEAIATGLLEAQPDWGEVVAEFRATALAHNSVNSEKVNQALAAFRKADCLFSFSFKVTFDWDDEDNPIFVPGFPIETLQELTTEYTLICNEANGLVGDSENPRLPLYTALSFHPSGRKAVFSFFGTSAFVPGTRLSKLKNAAGSWLMGQLSDGFGEDLRRYEILVGNQVLCPYFNHFARESPPFRAGRDSAPAGALLHNGSINGYDCEHGSTANHSVVDVQAETAANPRAGRSGPAHGVGVP